VYVSQGPLPLSPSRRHAVWISNTASHSIESREKI
jgi:hypothetical protein